MSRRQSTSSSLAGRIDALEIVYAVHAHTYRAHESEECLSTRRVRNTPIAASRHFLPFHTSLLVDKAGKRGALNPFKPPSPRSSPGSCMITGVPLAPPPLDSRHDRSPDPRFTCETGAASAPLMGGSRWVVPVVPSLPVDLVP